MDNICRFIPNNTAPDSIQIINFVYETKRIFNNTPRISSVYVVHYVTEGRATVQCESIRREVSRGDIFFVFPSVPYVIEGDEDFQYLYISFIGIRANMLAERLGINRKNFVFENFCELDSIWQEGIKASNGLIDLYGESVLMYTLVKIGERTSVSAEQKTDETASRFLLVKKYIDDNFSDCDFSLERLSTEFSYNKKYISNAFKKHFKVGIVEYVNIMRINHACVLIEQKYTSVSDIAFLCGYDDPMYFSRVFKKRMGMSPREYMKIV